MSNTTEAIETESYAVSAALSVHYIVMALYSFGIFGVLVFLFISVMTNTGIDILQAALLLFVPILFSLHLLAVKGLKRAKAWGYNTSKILAYILLLGFPFGTVLGVILLIQLSKFRFSK